LGSFALAAAAVRVVIPMVAERLEESQVLKGAMAVTAVIYAVYPFMPGAWTMGLASALLGLALGMVQPMVMAALHQLIAPRLHGSAIGLRMMVLNVSSTVMPMLFGVGGAAVGAAHLFWLIAFITGSGSLLVKRLSRDLRQAERHPPD
jgi:sugar phosphate permease